MVNETYPIRGTAGELIPDEVTLLSTVEDGDYMSSASAVRYLILHCSATRADRDYTARQLERDHKLRGFRTVGYHFYVRKNGEVTKHRGLLQVGAHARPYNRCSIGICYEGGLDTNGKPADTRTPAQTEQIQLLLMKLLKLFPKAQICGHRDLPGTTPKECPCFNAKAVFGFLQNEA